MFEFTNFNFEQEVLTNNTPVLVDFSASYCPPCRALTPILENLSNEFDGKIKFGKVDTDENEEISSNYEISALPTILFFNKGKIIKKIVGFHNENQLRQILTEISS
jgi:thioredoxin 1